MKGCKNIRSGGDTSSRAYDGEGPFLTYIVYRSFAKPDPIPAIHQERPRRD